MNNKKLFDILENAENDSMDKLIEKCPEISDEQLDRILKMSERKYNMKSKGTKNTEKNIKVTENNVVEGVERTRRPSWLAPLSMAASLVLVAGIVIGSTAIIRKNSREPDDDMMASVTTSSETSTAEQLTSENVTDTIRITETTTVPITNEPVTTGSADADHELSIYVGKWRYIVSQTNNVSADGIEMATVEIRENGVYEYMGNDGSFSEGTVKLNFEEIGGTKVARLEFTGGTPFEAANYYDDGSHKELHLGNGDSARMIRIPDLNDITNYTGKWRYQTAENGDFSNEPVDVQGTVEIKDDKTYTYTSLDGTVKNGTVNIRTKEHSDALWLDFTDNISGERNTFFFDVTFPNMFFNGNGGRIVKVQEVTIDVKNFAGEWTHQVSDGNYTVDKGSKDIARLTINDDATYKYYDSDNNITTGDIKVRNEEYADGQAVIVIEFYDGDEVRFSTYYEGNYNVLSIGNGGMARFMRVN